MHLDKILEEIRENIPQIIITINDDEESSLIRVYGRTDKKDERTIISQFAMDWLKKELHLL